MVPDITFTKLKWVLRLKNCQSACRAAVWLRRNPLETGGIQLDSTRPASLGTRSCMIAGNEKAACGLTRQPRCVALTLIQNSEVTWCRRLPARGHVKDRT